MQLKDLTSKLNTIGKSMETNLKFQILTVGLFFAITQGNFNNNIPILGTDIPIDVLLIACPVIFIYLLSRFAIDSSFFFVTNNLLVNKIEELNTSRQEFRLHYPMSLFVTITLSSKLTLSKFRRILNKVLSTIIFVVPGINVGIGFFILINFMFKEFKFLFWFFLIIGLLIYAAILLVALIRERAVYSSYRHIPIAVFIASIATLVFLLNTTSLTQTSKENKVENTKTCNYPSHH